MLRAGCAGTICFACSLAFKGLFSSLDCLQLISELCIVPATPESRKALNALMKFALKMLLGAGKMAQKKLGALAEDLRPVPSTSTGGL